MTPAMIVASHAVMRRAASMNSSAINGTSEISTLSHRFPAGFSTCWNIRLISLCYECVFAEGDYRNIARNARHPYSQRERRKSKLPVPYRRNNRKPD